MKKFFLALPLLLSFEIQATQVPTINQPQETVHQSLIAQENSVSSYIPREVDVSRFLRLESKCYMVISRCVLQPINVIAPLISTILVAAGNLCQDSNQKASKILGWTGCSLSALEFITSVLLVKVNDKLQGIDDYIENQRIRERATEMATAIIAESARVSAASTPTMSSSESSQSSTSTSNNEENSENKQQIENSLAH